ncbi:MAG TPA: hypothetical protein VF678_14150, partial [bacterium]
MASWSLARFRLAGRGTGSAAAPARGHSVRFRLLAIALLPTLVILPLLLGVAIVRWNDRFNATLVSKVNGDLTIAHQYLARILENTEQHIKALGLSASFHNTVAARQSVELAALLEKSRHDLGLDFLYLLDADRRLVVTAPHAAARARRVDWPAIGAALRGSTSTAIDLF